MLHSHLKSPGIFWQRPLTQMSSKVHSSMSVKETERGRKRERGAQLWGISGSWDHGGKLAASNRKWRPLTFAKEWQFWGEKCPDTSRQTHTYTVREAAKVMKLCSSTSLDSAQVITVQFCLSWDSKDWTGYFRMFDTSAKWGQSAHSIESSNALSLEAWLTLVCC